MVSKRWFVFSMLRAALVVFWRKPVNYLILISWNKHQRFIIKPTYANLIARSIFRRTTRLRPAITPNSGELFHYDKTGKHFHSNQVRRIPTAIGWHAQVFGAASELSIEVDGRRHDNNLSRILLKNTQRPSVCLHRR
jgi:hypothetical protein